LQCRRWVREEQEQEQEQEIEKSAIDRSMDRWIDGWMKRKTWSEEIKWCGKRERGGRLESKRTV
jgi:hypothetical protein